MLTEDMLRALWPHGDSKVPGLVAGIAAAAPTVFPKYGLTDDLTIAHAMAQFSHECGAGTEMTENINYSAKRACQVWPTRFSSEADCYQKVGSSAGDPNFKIKLIDNVYGTRMGNRPGTHDGSDFIGRGLSQLTGRENYTKLGTKTGLDLINHPDLVSSAGNALECGVADFVMCGCLAPAQADDVREVTHRLNGGFIGLDERTQWLAKWKAALGADDAHGALWLQQSLNQLGATPPLATDGNFGPKSAAALKAFQTAHNLPATGASSADTIAAIKQALANA
jgi:putative chitinase